MPQRPGRHLDLFLVPSDGRALPVEAVQDALETHGFADGRRPGRHADRLVPGGYAGIRLDDPGEPRLYANGQGGFRVRCPQTGQSIVPAFQGALGAWRRGGDEVFSCPACGQSHRLSQLDFAPRAAFGRGAIVLIDVASARPAPDALSRLAPLLGPVVVVGARR